ncbi:MAG: MBL fold metallo-hydrolase [Marinobacterium sp.]|nr:MBL fold metallo-hydrolase [Marinobacterium sp.]
MSDSFYRTIICLALLASIGTSSFANTDCEPGRVRLQVTGSGGPELNDKRAGSSYLIWLDGKARVLIDMGPGSSLNLERSGVNISDIEAVLFSHLHVDHSADFPALIKASFFTGRRHNLQVFGPDANRLMPSTEQFVARLIGNNGAFRYLSEYYENGQPSRWKVKAHSIPLSPLEVRHHTLNNHIMLSSIPVHHGPVAALAWRVQLAGCAITFSGDMSNRYKTLSRLAANSHLLVAHNAIPEQARGVARNLHMPPSEIGRIAAESGSKALLLSHRMLRTLEREPETSRYIRQFYKGPLRFAEDLAQFDVPFLHDNQ